ncbi:MAG TPA: nucleoside permease [Gammaproteobacteria bacterium]|nr:nucleoside permease [Gammaproteobacteria bacterium]
MTIGIYTRLSVMMFLEFFIWGAWFVTMATYLTSGLGFSDGENALSYATQSWGAIVAPFIIGLVADKYVNAERLLGVIHLIGAVLMYLLANATEFVGFYPYLLLYMILYMPTLALVNAISFRQIDDPARLFGYIRFWGTLGWIIAGLLISYGFDWDAEASLLRNTFTMASVASLVLGIFSFTLPATPPQKGAGGGLREALGLDALALLRDRNFLVFFVASVLICIPLAFYYQHANQFLTEIAVENAAGIQTLGQVSELCFMLLVPFFLKRFGMKATLLIGMLAWAARYVLFAYGNAGELVFMLIVGIVLHGVCYDFFFVSGQVFTDSKAGPRYKSAAQGLITLATYGVGMLFGFWIAGELTNALALDGGGHEWRSIWLYPAAFATLVAVLFAVLFKNEVVAYKSAPTGTPARDHG